MSSSGASAPLSDSKSGLQVDSSQRARLVLLVHLGITVLAIAVVADYIVFSRQSAAVLGLYSFGLLVSYAWSVLSWIYIRRTAFDLYGMFISMAFLFHGSFAVLRLLGAEEAIYLLPDLNQATLVKSVLSVLVGFVFLHLGALLVEQVSRAKPTPSLGEKRVLGDELSDRSYGRNSLRVIGVILILISLPAMLLEVRDGVQLVSAGGYGALFLENRGTSGPFAVLLNICRDFYLTGALFLLASARRRPIVLCVAIALIGALSVYNLYLGHRAYALLPILATVWLWHNTVRRLPLLSLSVPVAIVGLYALPAIRQVRGLAGGQRFSIAELRDSLTSLPEAFVSLLGEAGGTLMTLGYTIELVPDARMFEAGATYVGAFANALPMVSWARPYGFGSEWLAWTIKPDWAANGFGFGYSFLAEAFLNFGWAGIPIVSLLIGAFAVYLMRWAGRDPARLVVVAVFIPSFLFFARGESIDLVRPLLWRGLFPYAALMMALRLGRSSNGGGAVGVRSVQSSKPGVANDTS